MSILKVTPRVVPVALSAAAPVGVRGRVHVAKVGRDGQRLPVRTDRNRRAWQRVWDHEQGNLITNGGLDHGMGNSSVRLSFAELITWVHVGTGNTAPAASDTALDSEVARTNLNLGLGTEEVTLPSTGQGRYRRVRAFDFDEAIGTLAEFGGGADDSTTVLTRALFVDESETPTPITKTSDEMLIITYDLLATVSPTTMTSAGTLDITGFGTFDVSSMFYQNGAGNTVSLLGIWNSTLRIRPVTAVATDYSPGGGTVAPGVPQLGITDTTLDTYVSGSYERTATATYGPRTTDVTLAGYEIAGSSGSNGGALCGFRFDDPSSLLKDKDFNLTLSAKLSVARS